MRMTTNTANMYHDTYEKYEYSYFNTPLSGRHSMLTLIFNCAFSIFKFHPAAAQQNTEAGESFEKYKYSYFNTPLSGRHSMLTLIFNCAFSIFNFQLWIIVLSPYFAR